jgi:dolichol-phosphate mannosyltransferase
MVSWVGFRQTGVPYVAAERFAGRPTYTYGTLLRLAKNGIFSFSNVPLRLVLTVGFIVSGLAVVETVFALVNRLGGFHVVPGWASLAIVVSFLGGIQLIVLGVMGEYVGLIYDEVKARPIYLVRELHGFEAEE